MKPVLTAAMVVLSLASWAPRGAAAELQLGVSGVHHVPPAVWQGLSRAERLQVLERRADLALHMGATYVRLGSFDPQLFGWDALHPPGSSYRDWDLADAAVALFQARGLTLCVTLPDLLPAANASASGDFVAALAERYDGDADFGVPAAAQNYEFPDIDESGKITVSDWQASPADKKAWAEAHRLAILEVGDEPRVAEQAGTIAEGDYVTQLEAAHQAIEQVGSSVRVMLAGTLMDDQSKTHFTTRLDGAQGGATTYFDLANAHIFGAGGDLTGELASAAVAKLIDWVAAVGHADAELWVGQMAFGSRPGSEACTDARCDERTQAASLVKLVLSAAADGFGVVAYAFPLELTGVGADSGRWEGTGLATVELIEGFSPHALPIKARPAYATWQRLRALLAGRDGAEITKVSGLPENARGFKVGDAGWVLWFDWSRETSPGAPYDEGRKKLVELRALEHPSLVVSPMWPESFDAEITLDAEYGATFAEELLPADGGTAKILLAQDPVWVVPSDQIVGPSGDAGDEPDAGGDTSGAEVVAEPPEKKADDGCSGAPTPPWPLLAVGLAAVAAWVARRRVRFGRR